MHTPHRSLILFLFCLVWILPSASVLAGASGRTLLQEEMSTPTQEETPTSTPPVVTPADVINAVNNLRLQHGMVPLAVHDALMQVAAQQANALAASEGAVGHERPCGMTLGEDLLSRGFALWGDLSQDGYRSENWAIGSSAEEIVFSWLGDDLHANTMLSPNRSHIGAAVAVSNQPYIVLETAYQTPSGKMQWGAEVFLTKIAASQAACAGLIGLSTQNAEYGDLSQYSVPVAINTARPDGDVVHEVQYGQTLWSIAIQYDTTIEQIKRLNNLTMDTIVPGWTLLIQKGATQPAAFAATSPTAATIRRDFPTPTPRPIYTPATTEIAPAIDASKFIRQNSTVVVALVISFSVLVAGIVGFGKRKGS